MKPAPSARNKTLQTDSPLYKEVRQQILETLARGEWKPGEQLPNEADLAKRFGVAVSTVRAGVGMLTAAGILVRRQGKGTFVTTYDRHGPQFRFSNIYARGGRKVTTTRKITSIARERADHETTALLGLDTKSPPYVHHAEAVLKINDHAVASMELILPSALFPRLKKSDLEHTDENLYAIYQSRFGITVLRMEEHVSACSADKKTAKILGVPLNHPLLLVERLAYSFNNRPVEVRRRMYEGLQHYYRFTDESLD